MKLADDFTLDRYGLHVRLVNENDADFIVKLRVDPKLGHFIHAIDNDVEKQKEWIRQYKIREKEGKEYYFIYYYEGEPIGLYRAYNIKADYVTGGSWVCKPGLPFELPILTSVIFREIIFNDLNLSYESYDIRKKNYKSLRISEFFGGIKTMETDLDYYFELSKETFLQRRKYVLELLNMNK